MRCKGCAALTVVTTKGFCNGCYIDELEAENNRLERAWLALQKRASADRVVELELENKALREWVRKAVEDSECGVIPRNHIDRGSALLQEQGYD